MSAIPKLATPDVLPQSVDHARELAGDTKSDVKSDVVVAENNSAMAAQPMSTQSLPAQAAKPNDPLRPLKVMTEEEIIALFT